MKHKVTFLNQNKEILVDDNTSILEAARKSKITIESPCNGTGVCRKCKVKLDKKSLLNITEISEKLSEKEKLEGFVLACESFIKGDINVLITDKNNDSLKILSAGKSFDFDINPFVSKKYDVTNDDTKLLFDNKSIVYEKGNTSKKIYGSVVDIGTTTLVTTLIDITTGIEIDSESSLNPQSIYAQDVLSRIKFASDDSGLKIMFTEIIKQINVMLNNLCSKNNVDSQNIYEIVFSGNTTMIHLALNTNPYSLGKYPYISKVESGTCYNAADYNINISKYGCIYIPPIISAFVGADITSGILACELNKNSGTVLFIDIGTNGEMVISFSGKLYATSTAAGPAFEGMNISCGMRAQSGAIEKFDIDIDGNISIKTIENTEGIGICGSGLFDIVGEIVNHELVNNTGRFVNPDNSALPLKLKQKLIKKDGKTIFCISDKVYISQKDIRQVQLAKGAVRAGVEFLLKNRELNADKVDKVLIAGSFGYHLKPESLINIGLLPKEFENKIEFVGNTSKTGGRIFLLNKEYRKKIKNAVKDVKVVELANCKDFDKVFIKCLNF